MNMKTIEQVAASAATGQKWYLRQCEVARLMGVDRNTASTFLIEHSVPYYRISKEKSYFLPEVLEAVEKTHWKGGEKANEK